MSNPFPTPVGLPAQNVRSYTGPLVNLTPCMGAAREPTTSDKQYIWTEWRVDQSPSSGTVGDFWKLVTYLNGLPIWVKISNGSSGPMLEFDVPAGTSPVVPDSEGVVTYTSSGGTLTITGSTNTVNFDLAGGSLGIDSIAVDAHTAPGTDPVVPDAFGEITIEGGATFATGTQANPIRTNSLAANTLDLQIQLAGSNASASTANNFGVAQFDSNQFDVASGFVNLKGSTGPAATKFPVPHGTTPVVPDSSGQITLLESGGVTITGGTNQITFSSTSQVTPGPYNIGISYSASTFSVCASDGTALSSTNKGYITLQSKSTPGQLIQISVTANQTFVDDSGSSTIVGNLFGFAVGDTVASNDIPFFLYAVVNDSNNSISFMISRTPGMSISPNAANIGKTGSAVADNGYSFFALDDPTVANYDSNPCIMIGSFRMRLTTAGGDWTVQTLSGSDGIGNFQTNTYFTLPTGVLGAASGSYFLNNGGTAPTVNSGNYSYAIDRDGMVECRFGFATINVDGAGAVSSELIVPFQSSLVSASDCVGWGRLEQTTPAHSVVICFLDTSVDYIQMSITNATAGVSAILKNNDFVAASNINSFRLNMQYHVSTG